MTLVERISRRVRSEVEYRFQGTLWVVGVPPLYCGLCDVFQPKEGSDVIVALMDAGGYKVDVLAGHIRAGCRFVVSSGGGDLYVPGEVWPYNLRILDMLCPYPWEEVPIILKFEAESRRHKRDEGLEGGGCAPALRMFCFLCSVSRRG